MASVAIVLGSVRPGRAGEQVVRWIEEQARQADGVSTVFWDLRDYQLPLFAEEIPPSMQAPKLPEAVRLRTNIAANVKPLEHLREILSTFGADVRDQQVGINLGSDFQDGVFRPSDDLNAQIRELLVSLA